MPQVKDITREMRKEYEDANFNAKIINAWEYNGNQIIIYSIRVLDSKLYIVTKRTSENEYPLGIGTNPCTALKDASRWDKIVGQIANSECQG